MTDYYARKEQGARAVKHLIGEACYSKEEIIFMVNDKLSLGYKSIGEYIDQLIKFKKAREIKTEDKIILVPPKRTFEELEANTDLKPDTETELNEVFRNA